MRRRAVLAAFGGLAGIGVAGEVFGDQELELTSVTVENVPSQVAFDVDLLDPEVYVSAPGELELSVTNSLDEPVTFYNRGIAPFGVPALTTPDGREIGALHSPAYEESALVGDFREVEFDGPPGYVRNLRVDRVTEVSVTLDPDETRTESYTVRQFETWNEPDHIRLAGGVAPLLWFEPAGADERIEADLTVHINWQTRSWLDF